ncbi:TetR family transcriptional regulator [Trabulsiella guamensis ATCC 49490]|uniref:TetR family transcriptional regulator n=1 Tax=Trabulsiella guamensis ATCC 49490 TaxID=1005994 RepID=A0A085ASS3_9ENTR|nr:TetR/AcrR family transcriptional regulator [Trabulsiella guamensis]KFC13268.1 TetR family transcriptional regulator [Trabulsiella guamensis ATCC 49490]
MKVSRAKAEENRRAVVKEAAKLFREHGIDGVALSGIMGAVGLTQGGFYKQFGSKDELAVEACEQAMAANIDTLNSLINSSNGDVMAAIIDRYLSPEHRNNPAVGCAIAALVADVARREGPLRQSFENGIRGYSAVIEKVLSSCQGEKQNDMDALAILSMMVGALMLSRAVEDENLSRRILEAAADAIPGCSKTTASTDQ